MKGLTRSAAQVILATGLALQAGVCRAQQTIADDFESGQLVSPGGVWSALSQEASVVVAEDPLAAHRGDAGLRVSDQTDAGASGPEGFISFSPSPSFASGVYFFRGWFRLTSSHPGSGLVDIIALLADGGTGPRAPAVLRLDFPNNALEVVGQNAAGVVTTDTIVSMPAPNTWHLLEVWVEGWGSAAGGFNTAVDGVKYAARTALDYTGLTLDTVQVGEVDASGSDDWTGILDFDDVRTSAPTQPASHFVLDAGSGAFQQGACVQAVVSLYGTSGGAAVAPYAVQVGLSSSTPATIYANPACSGAGGVVIAPSTSGASFGIVFAQAGNATITASHMDFLNGSAVFDVAPAPPDAGLPDAGGGPGNDGGSATDAGVADAGLSWTVGCSCEAGSSGAGWLPALALLAAAFTGWRREERRGLNLEPPRPRVDPQ